MSNKTLLLMVVVCIGISSVMAVIEYNNRGGFVVGGEWLLMFIPIAFRMLGKQIKLVINEVIND